MPLGTVKLPTLEQLEEVAEDLGFTMSEDDLETYLEAMVPAVAAYNMVDLLPDEKPLVRYPRTPGYRPVGEENRYGAWYVKSRIEGAASGKLKGKEVAIKDNVCVAGVPMTNGASTLEGYVPDVDATIVARILDAGGTIVGKTVCEYFCFSGGSHTSSTGPVHNPRKMGYSAGGSSSGSGAVVAAGEVPMAIGGDQGGSIRMPAAYLRHLRHEADARAGTLHRHHADRAHHRPYRPDDRHGRGQRAAPGGPGRPRWARPAPVRAGADRAVHGSARQGRQGLRIAVIPEGFGHPQSLPAVDRLVRNAADELRVWGPRSTRSRSRCTAWATRSGCRWRPRVPPSR